MNKRFIGLTERTKKMLLAKKFSHCYLEGSYTDPSGRVYFEEVQPMACNPNAVFLALKREDGSWVKESLWTPAEALSKEEPMEVFTLEELGGIQIHDIQDFLQQAPA